MLTVPTSNTPQPHAHAKLAAGASQSSRPNPHAGAACPKSEAFERRSDLGRKQKRPRDGVAIALVGTKHVSLPMILTSNPNATAGGRAHVRVLGALSPVSAMGQSSTGGPRGDCARGAISKWVTCGADTGGSDDRCIVTSTLDHAGTAAGVGLAP